MFTTAAGWGAAARSPDSDGSSQELIYFVLVIAPPAAAVLINWDGNESVDGSFDGEFDVANNWNPDQVPAAGHLANFNADATYTVTFGSDEAADDMRVIDGVVTFLSDSSAVRTFDLISGAMDANVSGGQLYIGSEDNPVVVNVGDIMNIGSNAPGTSIVEVGGTMSALNAGSAIHHVGRNGNSGILRALNGATANYGGTLRVGVDNNSQGFVWISLGGTLNTGHIELATVGSGGDGTMRVTDSGSSINQTIPGSTLTVGSAAGKSGAIDVRDGGNFTSGTGTTTVNATATVNVGVIGDGTFNANGDFNIVGGTLHVGGDAGDVFTLGSGQTLTASAGGQVDFDGAYEIVGTFDVQDATFDADGALTTAASGTLTLAGGAVNANAGLDVSAGTLDFRDGKLTVTGGAFAPNAGNYAIDGLVEDDRPHLELGAGATANLGIRSIIVRNGELTISGGGAVSSSVGFIGSFSDGTATVDGEGSTWTNSFDLSVGGISAGAGETGNLTVQNNGLVDVNGTLRIGNSGTVTLDGGSIVTDTFDNTEGGTFNFMAGSLTINSGIEIGAGTAFSHSVSLNSDQVLITPATTTVAAFRTLTLDGGSLQTGDLAINGTLQLNSGTLGITGAGGLTVGAAGPFGSSLSIGAGQILDVTNTLTVDAEATLSLTTGGNISAGAVSNSGQLHGNGILAGPLTNNADGEVQGLAGSNLVLTGSGNSNNGRVTLSGGQVHFTQDFTNSSTGLVIGNGTLRADGGAINDGDVAFSATANVIGDVTNSASGTVISAGGTTTFFDDVVHNGVQSSDQATQAGSLRTVRVKSHQRGRHVI